MKRSPAHLIEALDALLKHEGWQLCKERMQEEIQMVTTLMAGQPDITEAQLHWRRGTIYAAQRLLQLPELLRDKIKNDAILQTATSPAKAGQKGKLP